MQTHRDVDGTIKAPSPAITTDKPKRRWRQYSLRALLLVVTLTCILLAAWMVWLEPLRQEGLAIKALVAAGAGVTTEPAYDDSRQRLLPESMSKYLTSIQLRGPQFDDDTFSLLYARPRLTGVSLIGTQVTLAAVEKFVDGRAGRNCSFALAEWLYQSALADLEIGVNDFDALVREFFWAAEWKLACAALKESPDNAAIQARKQLVEWLRKVVDRAEHTLNAAPPGAQRDVDISRCALALAECRLARAQGDRHAEGAACRRGLEAADSLCARARSTYLQESVALKPLIHTLRLRQELHDVRAELDEDPQAALAVLRALSNEYDQLANTIKELREREERGGETDNHTLIETLLAQTNARIANAKRDRPEELEALADAARWSHELREANAVAFQIGVLTRADVYSGEELSLQCDLALARATKDTHAEEDARQRYRLAMKERSRHEYYFILGSAGGGDASTLALAYCRLATAEIEAFGESFFHDTQANIEADWEQPEDAAAD